MANTNKRTHTHKGTHSVLAGIHKSQSQAKSKETKLKSSNHNNNKQKQHKFTATTKYLLNILSNGKKKQQKINLYLLNSCTLVHSHVRAIIMCAPTLLLHSANCVVNEHTHCRRLYPKSALAVC